MRLPCAPERLEERTLLSVDFLPGPLAAGRVSRPVSLGDSGLSSVNVEPQVVVDPGHPNRLLLGTQFAWKTSVNNGASFTRTRETPFYSDGDITSVYDSKGRLFYVNILDGTLNPITPGPPDESGIAVTRLDSITGAALDKGHYVDNVTTSDSLSDDKPSLAVDRRTDDLFVAWAQYDSDLLGRNKPAWRIRVAFSADQGKTWSPAKSVTPTNRAGIVAQGFVWPPTVSVAADGTVLVAYHAQPDYTALDPTLGNPNPQRGTGQVWVVAYRVEGHELKELSRTRAFGPGQADLTFNVQSSSHAHPHGVRQVPGAVFWTLGSGQTWLLPDVSRPGHVYAVTSAGHDLRGGSYGDVVFASSADDGRTWSKPSLLVNNDAEPSRFSFFPTAAIDRNGDLAVAWYQNYRGATLEPKNAHGHYLLDVYATYSSDGGTTWATPFRLTRTSSDPDVAADPKQSRTFNESLIRFSNTDGGFVSGDAPYTTRIGEYFGLSILDNTVYAAWDGNGGSRDRSQRLYFTTFGINGTLRVTPGQGNTVRLAGERANPAFLLVGVNRKTEYAGLLSSLTGVSVTSDTLVVDAGGEALRVRPGTVNVAGRRVSYAGVARLRLENAAAVNALAGPDTADRDRVFIGLNADERFVQALYLDALARPGGKKELEVWAARLDGSGAARQRVAAGIESSFEARAHLVRAWYIAFLGRPAAGGEELAWARLLGKEPEETVLARLLGGEEFFRHTGGRGEGFVRALYRLLLDRPASAAEVSAWVAALPGLGRAGVANALLHSQEYRTGLVEACYNALLHRPSDPAGLQAWLSSGLAMHALRVHFEATDDFYRNG